MRMDKYGVLTIIATGAPNAPVAYSLIIGPSFFEVTP